MVLVTSAAVRAQNPTAAPSADSTSTIARPIPRVPPVTRARRPCRPRSTSLPPRLNALIRWLARRTGPAFGAASYRCCLLPVLRRGLAQPLVHAVVRGRRREQGLGHLRHHAVV